MSSIATFNKSVQGSRHIAKKKPCQDYSLCSNEGGIQVLVVCDGHGGATYVRSEIGARLAALSTKEILLDFVRNNPDNVFEGVSMAVTAQPQRNPFIDIDGNKVKYENLDETQQEVARQAKEYVKATEHHQEQQDAVRSIVQSIISSWREGIENHYNHHPLNREEKRLLNGNGLDKAYGCTVLAFLRTQTYWLALQIGDGKIVTCDKKGEWAEPVPRDCECFLNRTTSLCDKYPEKEFRYALSGEGEFPVSVFLCSDGVDGSLGEKENLYDFYGQIMELTQDRTTDINHELEDFLPELSEKGNHDDVSVAGLVDTDWIVKNVELLKLISEEKNFMKERANRMSALKELQSRSETISIKLYKAVDSMSQKEQELERWEKAVEKERNVRETEISDMRSDIDKLESEYSDVEKELAEKREELKEWSLTAKVDLAKIGYKKKAILDGKADAAAVIDTDEVPEKKDLQQEKHKPSADSVWD